MRTLLRMSLVAAIVSLVAIPQLASGQDELVESFFGTWKGNKEKTVELLKEQGVSDDEIEGVSEEVENVTLTLGEDNSFSVGISFGGAEQKLEGTWEMKSSDAEKKEVVFLFDIPEFGEAQEMTFKAMEGGEFVRVAPDGQPPAVFEKQED